MKEEYLALLKDAARWTNRNKVVSLTLKSGEILKARIIVMPCECGECTDEDVIYEHVWSSSPEHQAKWENEKDKIGGYGIPLSFLEKAELDSD